MELFNDEYVSKRNAKKIIYKLMIENPTNKKLNKKLSYLLEKYWLIKTTK